MKAGEVGELFTSLEYERDVRRPPDERRRGRFHVGWRDAVERGEVYAGDTLEQLTWHNLGYRLGGHFGDQPPEQIDQAFELLAEAYEPSGPGRNQVPAPSSQQYMAALRRIGILTDRQIQMLRIHYYAPDRTITATEMARSMGHEHYSFANSQYGRLGRLVGEQLDYNPMQERLGTLVTFDKRRGEWHWLMRPEVAQALESLGWVETIISLPGELSNAASLFEGAVRQVSVNAYERNPKARRRCIEYHGTSCCICGFNFGAVYGEVADGFIHVHHLRSLSDIGMKYEVDPIEDLRPVCPNCHAVLHRRSPAFSIEEIRALLKL
jgi:5-methylcytosine-specific restriction protein A